MTDITRVIFFHGAGEGAFEADALLAASLRRELGPGYEVVQPRLPADDDAGDSGWLRAIDEAVTGAPAVLVGHSAGGYLLLKYLATHEVTATALAIIAAPFPGGDGDWTFDGFDLPRDFGARLPECPVFLYASEDDEVVPFAHRDLYAAAIPGAVSRTTEGGHQLGDDLGVVARDIRSVVGGPRP